MDGDGKNRISTEDFAVAVVDEIEHARHPQRRFTVGYWPMRVFRTHARVYALESAFCKLCLTHS